jgi:branched-chain amino acid transport system permease protein
MTDFFQHLVEGLSLGAIYALIALGYTMVYGVLRFINFAHGELFMVGAYTGALVGEKIASKFSGQSCWLGAGLVFVIAMSVAAVLGVVIERVAYRPLRNRPKINVLITAIGVSLLLQNLTQVFFGATPRAFPDLLAGVENKSYEVAGVFITLEQILAAVATVVLLIALWCVVRFTKTGLALRALAQNRQAAALMGVNEDRVISFTFALGSALAAAGGVLFAMNYSTVNPYMGMMPGVKAFVAAVLGGIGSLPGAVIGALTLGLSETFASANESLSSFRDGIAFALLIVLLLFRPAGLLGKIEREKV